MLTAASGAAKCPNETYGSASSIGKFDVDAYLCLDAINAKAVGSAVPRATALGVLVAHEVGHRFNLLHYANLLTYHPTRLNESSSISLLISSSPPTSSTNYVEDITQGNVCYTKLRFRKDASSELVSYLPVDKFDYLLYTQNDLNHALSGLAEKELLVNSESELAAMAAALDVSTGIQLHPALTRITLASNLNTAPAGRYQTPARLDTYEKTLIMSHLFLFEIGAPSLSQYGFSRPPGGNPAYGDDIARIQLEK